MVGVPTFRTGSMLDRPTFERIHSIDGEHCVRHYMMKTRCPFQLVWCGSLERCSSGVVLVVCPWFKTDESQNQPVLLASI
ncbi:hypothetical protein AVEN_55047-1 [Araneus ventricosus]|uniref:Uncharacterized protein n=1 Tax=Araneus ventricosus TaxID=182803 RepID=A0A4Y2GT38_ARAVE|nr:hypothetical protein AVEN_55047-1 [Araneus ventricosus]